MIRARLKNLSMLTTSFCVSRWTNRLKKQFWSSDFFWRKVNNFPCSLMPWFHYTNNFNKVIIFASFCFSFFISLGIRLVVFWTAFLGPFFSSRVRSCNSSTLIRCQMYSNFNHLVKSLQYGQFQSESNLTWLKMMGESCVCLRSKEIWVFGSFRSFFKISQIFQIFWKMV